MRAERGLFDDYPVIPLPELEEFLPHHPHVSVEMVPDVNHFTLIMGSGHGPRRVAATLAEVAAQTVELGPSPRSRSRCCPASSVPPAPPMGSPSPPRG
jgi:hypothetical protein